MKNKILISCTLIFVACSQNSLDSSPFMPESGVPPESESGVPPESRFCGSSNMTEIDTSFGFGGYYQYDHNGSNNGNRYSNARVAVDGDGNIVLSGKTHDRGYDKVMLHMIDSDGSPSNSFGVEGTRIFDLGQSANGKGIGVFEDYFFVAVNGSYGKSVLKVDKNGDLDSTFGSDGIASHSNDTSGDAVYLDDSGRIYHVGHTSKNPPHNPSHKLSATRFNNDGIIDTAFATNGYLTSDSGDNQFGYGFTFSKDFSQFYMVSEVWSGGEFQAKITRYNTNDGSVDTSFAENGEKVFGPTGNNRAKSIKISPAGDLFVLGFDSDGDGHIFKLDPAGNLDTSFGNNGLVQLDLGNSLQIKDLYFLNSYYWVIGEVSISNVVQMVLFKLDKYGNIDTSFSTDGYKLYPWPNNQSAYFHNSIRYNDSSIIVSFTIDNSQDDDLGVLKLCL